MMMPFLKMLLEHDVRFVVIGGQAMRHLGMPRFTMDWDVCIPHNDIDNFERINEALTEIDEMPVVPLGPKGENFVQTYQTPWGVVQFHLRPVGVSDFNLLEKNAQLNENGIKYACAEDMLAAKQAVNRPEDQLDIEFLREKSDVGGDLQNQ